MTGPSRPAPAFGVRTAVPADAARIAELYRQLVDDPEVRVLPEWIERISREPGTALFVYERAGDVIGTTLVTLCSDVMYGEQPFAVLENFVVDSACRSMGAGSVLLRHVESFCLAGDCYRMMLLSACGRRDAIVSLNAPGSGARPKRDS